MDFFTRFGIIQGKLVTTDGQLIPSYSRYKGCTHASQGCLSIPLEHLKGVILSQLRGGVKRIQITCPFAEVVEKVVASTAKKGKPKEPKVFLMEVEYLASGIPDKDLIQMLGAEVEALPPVKIKWNRLRQTEQGSLFARCPKAPSDPSTTLRTCLEAKVGYHVDNQNPDKKEAVFGYNHQRTADINEELGLELPVGISTYPANENEGSNFIQHRSKIHLPVTPGQVQVVDGSYDAEDNYSWLRQRKAIPIVAYNPRRENLSSEALLERGYNQNGTPFAPCERLCHSNGYNYQACPELVEGSKAGNMFVPRCVPGKTSTSGRGVPMGKKSWVSLNGCRLRTTPGSSVKFNGVQNNGRPFITAAVPVKE